MDSNNIQASTHVCLVAKTFHLEIGSPSSKKKKKNGQEFSVCQQNSNIMAISFFNRRAFYIEIKDSRSYNSNCYHNINTLLKFTGKTSWTIPKKNKMEATWIQISQSKNIIQKIESKTTFDENWEWWKLGMSKVRMKIWKCVLPFGFLEFTKLEKVIKKSNWLNSNVDGIFHYLAKKPSKISSLHSLFSTFLLKFFSWSFCRK